MVEGIMAGDECKEHRRGRDDGTLMARAGRCRQNEEFGYLGCSALRVNKRERREWLL
jgi:hypothetical protein